MLYHQKLSGGLSLWLLVSLLAACVSPAAPSTLTPIPTNAPAANLPNPASVYCEEQGNRLEIRTATDGSQSGVCVFSDGSECDEWAYFRGECGPTPPSTASTISTEIPTALPIDPTAYEGWWTYTHAGYGFSLLLPEDWVVDETTTFDAQMSGHNLNLHPELQVGLENIRLTFRRVGEEARLWPTGVGQGEFIEHGTLGVAGQSARRVLLVCPTGEVTAIWYHNVEDGQPNITRGDMEFGFIYTVGEHCAPGKSLSGKVQRVGEMIMASLKVP